MTRKAQIWKYFIKIGNGNNGGGQCTICQKVLKTKSNTTNLHSHLKTIHKIEVENYVVKSKQPRITEEAESVKSFQSSIRRAGFTASDKQNGISSFNDVLEKKFDYESDDMHEYIYALSPEPEKVSGNDLYETEETKNLTTEKLRRLLLLEQLQAVREQRQYIKEKRKYLQEIRDINGKDGNALDI